MAPRSTTPGRPSSARHAIANGVYVASPNRVGVEHGDIRGNRVKGEGLQFWGGSFIADPFGRIIAKASHEAEEILIAEVDLKLLEDQRRNWPFLRDRRIDSYQPHRASVPRWHNERESNAGTGTERANSAQPLAGTPREHGFRMPAEWAPHAATWLAWPHNPNDWPGKFQPIAWVYAEIIRHLSQVEDVHVCVQDEPTGKRARPASCAAPVRTWHGFTCTHGQPTASGPATPVRSLSRARAA